MMRQFSFLSGIGLCPYADALSFVGFSVIFVKSSFVLRVCGFCGEADCFHPQVIDAHSFLVLVLCCNWHWNTLFFSADTVLQLILKHTLNSLISILKHKLKWELQFCVNNAHFTLVSAKTILAHIPWHPNSSQLKESSVLGWIQYIDIPFFLPLKQIFWSTFWFLASKWSVFWFWAFCFGFSFSLRVFGFAGFAHSSQWKERQLVLGSGRPAMILESVKIVHWTPWNAFGTDYRGGVKTVVWSWSFREYRL